MKRFEKPIFVTRPYLPDLDELKQLVTPDTKLICINNPNNPNYWIDSEDATPNGDGDIYYDSCSL